MAKPTQNDLDITRATLEWVGEYMEREEPYAINSIAAFKQAADELPYDAEDLGE